MVPDWRRRRTQKQSQTSSLIQANENLKKSFEVKKVVLVADQALFNDKNRKDMEEKNIQYVVAAKMKSFPKTKRKEVLEADFEPAVVENEFQWFKEFEHKERRLIVSYSSKRAKKDMVKKISFKPNQRSILIRI